MSALSGSGIQLGPHGPGQLTDEDVRDFFRISERMIIALLGTDNHQLVRLRRKPNPEGKPVDPEQPLAIVRNSFGSPIEVRNV